MYYIKNQRIGIYIAFCQLSTEWRTVSATSYNMALNYVKTCTRYDIKLLPITDSINTKLISFHHDTQTVISFRPSYNIKPVRKHGAVFAAFPCKQLQEVKVYISEQPHFS